MEHVAHSHTPVGRPRCPPPLSAPCHPAPRKPAYYPCICLITLNTYNYNNLTAKYCFPSLVCQVWETQKKAVLLRCRLLMDMQNGVELLYY